MSQHRIYVGPVADPAIVTEIQKHPVSLVEHPSDADWIVWLAPNPADLAAILHEDVQWVQLKVAGIDAWVASGVMRPDIVWSSARGAYARPVAEHALALLLASARRLHDSIGTGTWGEPGSRFGRVFRGSTVSIIGAGAIGDALIELLAPFDVTVLAVTRSGRDVPGAAASYPTDAMDAAWEQADYVVLAAPGTPETKHMANARTLGLMRSDAWLVNVGRGSLVDDAALADALDAGTIGGAALDVTDPEPLPDGHRLWSTPNTIITPHTANPPEANSVDLAERVGANIARMLSGEPLLGFVRPGDTY